ncbi:uncharacterized protein LOC129576991 [Sitodiplosis mosellana]|uniref:uncharacterized protein LOC129576991 n=1 Tax=Sitodiplosis mosellana TaxID=263140 RepID=UPI002443E776|nr:uncharacterized protein LOC129576991 [Sitodiplosis mosellana]XP_055319303.1 uncharacterized protein LOC129576991 [Sitodiplosis mosellana]XP_055319304.1 uncharacterized protein LOC129576991 [Sitodiplosis mosellana]XP_055319305.1 uncharacterized protein LOC129576991 [Sitodiplosis mosellana]
MANPIFRSCCNCQSLRTGSVIAGVAAILLSIVSIIIMFTVRLQYKTIFLDWLPPWIVKIVIGFNLCMTILISIIMIVGAIKRNHYLMLPWVVLGAMLVVGLLLSVIYTGVMFIIDGHIITAVVWFIGGLIFCVIYAYMWCVVYSHFTVLREESKRGKYNRQPYRR